MKPGNFYHIVYTEFYLHLYCYIDKVSLKLPLAFFRCFVTNSEAYREVINSIMIRLFSFH